MLEKKYWFLGPFKNQTHRPIPLKYSFKTIIILKFLLSYAIVLLIHFFIYDVIRLDGNSCGNSEGVYHAVHIF